MKKRYSHLPIYLVLLLGSALVLFPMYITVIVAFKSPEETARSFFAMPSGLYLDNFARVISEANFSYFITNSLIITLASLAGIAFFIPLVSYSLSRNMNRRYYRILYYIFVSGAFVPFTVMMVPQIKLMSALSLMNKFGLIVLYWVFALSEGCLLCVSYVNGIPRELEEAAFIDGAGVFHTFIRIIYPVMMPVIIAVMIMDALWIWNDFQLPLLMLNASEKMWTLPLFQYNFKTKYTVDYSMAFAAFMLSTLPIMVFYLAAQKQIVAGLTAGAVKS